MGDVHSSPVTSSPMAPMNVNPLGAFAVDVAARTQEQALATLLSSAGDTFPGSGHRPVNRKTWMAGLGPQNVRVHQVLWPGTHNSATNGIGNFVTRPFAQCQSLSIYEQLAMGCRVLDVRVQKDRLVCHGPILGYPVDVVLGDVRRFLGETSSEVVILEIRTEFDQEDPPGFDRFLVDQLGDHLIRQDDQVFNKSIAQLLPRRVICVWKPRKSPAPNRGGLLWSAEYLKDDWIDTDLPKTKFDNNLRVLGQNPPVPRRRFFYRVENTVTPKASNFIQGPMAVTVEPVTRRIHRFARLFISQAAKLHGDKLQIFSTDFIDQNFVDACAGATKARVDASLGV